MDCRVVWAPNCSSNAECGASGTKQAQEYPQGCHVLHEHSSPASLCSNFKLSSASMVDCIFVEKNDRAVISSSEGEGMKTSSRLGVLDLTKDT